MHFSLVKNLALSPALHSGEFRRAPRFDTLRLVAVTQLVSSLETLTAGILDVSSQGMKLKLTRSLPIGAAVKIDFESDLVLGEIRYCLLDEDGSYIVGVEIDQILKNASEVAHSWAKA